MLSKYSFLFNNFGFLQFLDIVILAIVIYSIYLFAAKTRALAVLYSFAVILFLSFLTYVLELSTLHQILNYIISFMPIGIIVLFPEEIRKGLYQIAKKLSFDVLSFKRKINESEMIEAIKKLKKNKLGMIIVLKGIQPLEGIEETGVTINSSFNWQLVLSIADKNSPLHDGAITVKKNKIIAASCFIPNLSSQKITRELGTRHRAGLGLSETSDSFVIISSEENGHISIAYEGKLEYNLSIAKLKRKLLALQ